MCDIISIGFSTRWVDKVMDLLRSTRFSILIHGNQSKNFHPSRGLRRGCPLSPYLFLLCSQGLSSLLKNRVSINELHGISARNAPDITHLFFADVTLLIGHSTHETAGIFRDILQIYEEGSGQVINQKSSTTFSHNTDQSMKNIIFSTLSMHPNESYEVYLGLPSFSRRNKKDYLMEFVKKCGGSCKLGKARCFQ